MSLSIKNNLGSENLLSELDTQESLISSIESALAGKCAYSANGTFSWRKCQNDTDHTFSHKKFDGTGWSNSEYSFESTYPTATYDVSIELNGDSATDEQIEAWSGAKMVGSSSANKVYAKGDVPTVDLPIIVKAVAK